MCCGSAFAHHCCFRGDSAGCLRDAGVELWPFKRCCRVYHLGTPTTPGSPLFVLLLSCQLIHSTWMGRPRPHRTRGGSFILMSLLVPTWWCFIRKLKPANRGGMLALFTMLTPLGTSLMILIMLPVLTLPMKVRRTGPCHCAGSTAYSRSFHLLPSDTHSPRSHQCFHAYQSPISKFQKMSHKHTPWQPLAMEIQIRDPPIRIEGDVEDGGTWVHRYMKVMEKGTNNDNLGQRS